MKEIANCIRTMRQKHRMTQAELAQALGIAFKPTLQPWEYDKEKRKEHQAELNQAEKEERR